MEWYVHLLFAGFIALFGAIAWVIWQVERLFLFGEVIHHLGQVMDHEERRSKNGRTYAPIIRFYDESGAERHFTDSVGSSPPSPAIGAVVTLLYPKGREDLIRLKRRVPWQLLGLSFIIALILIAGFLWISLAMQAGMMPAAPERGWGRATR